MLSGGTLQGISRYMKRTIVCLLIVALATTAGLATKSGSKSPSRLNQSPAARNGLATKRWPEFVAAFRAAVNKRDRAALRGMIMIPFNTQEGVLTSANDVLKLIDQEKWWGELKKETAPGARFTSSGRGNPKIGKCARDGIFCFEFGSDGRWRLSEQGENE
jgi:hypothetical protein